MKAIDDIEQKYKALVKLFLPQHLEQAGEIGYWIEKFFLDNDGIYDNVSELRLKEENDVVSESLYDAVKFESLSKKSEEDLWLLMIDGKNIFFGFNYN